MLYPVRHAGVRWSAAQGARAVQEGAQAQQEHAKADPEPLVGAAHEAAAYVAEPLQDPETAGEDQQDAEDDRQPGSHGMSSFSRALVRARWRYSAATKSVTPAAASSSIWSRTLPSSPTTATSPGPLAPSRSSIAR